MKTNSGKKTNNTVQDFKKETQIVKKTETGIIFKNKKIRNSNKNYRGKHHQQNARDGKENMRF